MEKSLSKYLNLNEWSWNPTSQEYEVVGKVTDVFERDGVNYALVVRVNSMIEVPINGSNYA